MPYWDDSNVAESANLAITFQGCVKYRVMIPISDQHSLAGKNSAETGCWGLILFHAGKLPLRQLTPERAVVEVTNQPAA
jgi:hypothetical protein